MSPANTRAAVHADARGAAAGRASAIRAEREQHALLVVCRCRPAPRRSGSACRRRRPRRCRGSTTPCSSPPSARTVTIAWSAAAVCRRPRASASIVSVPSKRRNAIDHLPVLGRSAARSTCARIDARQTSGDRLGRQLRTARHRPVFDTRRVPGRAASPDPSASAEASFGQQRRRIPADEDLARDRFVLHQHRARPRRAGPAAARGESRPRAKKWNDRCARPPTCAAAIFAPRQCRCGRRRAGCGASHHGGTRRPAACPSPANNSSSASPPNLSRLPPFS